jgi:type VI secretion system secreted protein Hcp
LKVKSNVPHPPLLLGLALSGTFLVIGICPAGTWAGGNYPIYSDKETVMPTPAYLSITGVKQGLITAGTFTQDSVGNIYQEGHEDQILVQAFSHQVIIPRDPQSGQPTGQRVHKPLMISKVFDKSSPLLFSALTSGEEVKCRLEWFRTSSAGTQEHYFTIELEGATIVDIQSRMPNCQDPENAHFTHLEDVHFTYRKIVWTHEVSGTSGSDDWRSPVAG